MPLTEEAEKHTQHKCPGCGSDITFSPGLQSLKCDYCGRIIQLTSDRDTLPSACEFIVPLLVSENQLELSAYEYMASGKYTCDDIIEVAVIKAVECLYCPFYRYTGRYTGTWSSSFGYDRQEPYTRWESDSKGGRHPVTAYRTVTDWRPASGVLDGRFDFLGYGGSRLESAIASRIAENASALEKITSDVQERTAGFEVEALQINRDKAFETSVKHDLDELIEEDVIGHAQGDYQENWHINSSFEYESHTVLMPVCRITFGYGENSFQVWLDGVNSEFLGGDPLPEDANTKHAVLSSFYPVVAATPLFLFAIFRVFPTNPSESAILLSGAACTGALLFGVIRRSSLLSYSYALRCSILNFQKASLSNTSNLSSLEQRKLAESIQKPRRNWLTRRGPFAWASALAITVGLQFFAALIDKGSDQVGTEQLCRDALTPDGGSWDQSVRYQQAVSEAKRRGFTVETCRRSLASNRQPSPAVDQSIERERAAQLARQRIANEQRSQVEEAEERQRRSAERERAFRLEKQRIANEQRRQVEEAEERQRRSAAAAQQVGAPRTPCDDLAANPNDRSKFAGVSGVPLSELKKAVDAALRECRASVDQYPNVLRFQYQLARVLQISDRAAAFPIFKNLVDKSYPAAQDNLGWMLFIDRKDPRSAVEVFKRGVQLGDPDSMVSLAEMVSRDALVTSRPVDLKIALYDQACQLGHERACRALEHERSNIERMLRDIEAQKQIIDLFGKIVGTMPRR